MTRLLTIFERVAVGLNVFSGVLIFSIICIVIVDIVGRWAFNAPLPGATVICILLLVCVVFLSLANVQRKKQHYRVDLVADLLPRGAQRIVDLLAHAISFAVVAVIARYSAAQAVTSFHRGEASYDLFAFPIWPARTVLAAGLVLLALQLLVDLVRDVVDLARGTPAP